MVTLCMYMFSFFVFICIHPVWLEIWWQRREKPNRIEMQPTTATHHARPGTQKSKSCWLCLCVWAFISEDCLVGADVAALIVKCKGRAQSDRSVFICVATFRRENSKLSY